MNTKPQVTNKQVIKERRIEVKECKKELNVTFTSSQCYKQHVHPLKSLCFKPHCHSLMHCNITSL